MPEKIKAVKDEARDKAITASLKYAEFLTNTPDDKLVESTVLPRHMALIMSMQYVLSPKIVFKANVDLPYEFALYFYKAQRSINGEQLDKIHELAKLQETGLPDEEGGIDYGD